MEWLGVIESNAAKNIKEDKRQNTKRGLKTIIDYLIVCFIVKRELYNIYNPLEMHGFRIIDC